jgi:hypothetical protein
VKHGLINHLNQLDARKPILKVPSNSQESEELRLYKPVLGFVNLKPRLESGIFKCISWLNGSFFLGSQDPSNGTNVT